MRRAATQSDSAFARRVTLAPTSIEHNLTLSEVEASIAGWLGGSAYPVSSDALRIFAAKRFIAQGR